MHVYTHATTPELTTLNDDMPSAAMVVDMADCMPSTSEAIDFGINEDDKSSDRSTPPLGLSMDEKAAEKRPATLYARLNKKVQSVYGKATRTALNNALKPTQDAFYKMTGKPTAFKAAQFAPKYWKNQVFNNGIPASFTAKTFPMNTYDRKITDPVSCYNDSIKYVTEQLEESCGSSSQFISTVKSLNGYIQKVAEAEVANSPNYVPNAALTKGLQIKKPGHFKTNALHQTMVKICSGGAHHADQRAFICASVLDAYSSNPISAKKPPTPIPVASEQPEEEEKEVTPLTEDMKEEKSNKKRKRESKDDKENVPTKFKRKDGLDKHKRLKKKSKNDIRRNGKMKILKRKREAEMNSRNKRIIRKIPESELYKCQNSIRVPGELRGERTTDRDLEYLKVRKLSIKTARRKPKSDFGIFCEATWFRKQLLHNMRDYPIPMDETEPPIHNSINGAKRKRRGSHMQDRASQFVYAHIPTPEDLPPLPCAPPINVDPCSNYDEIYEEYEKYVKKCHKKYSTREDFHWEEYLSEKLAEVPNKFRNVEDRLGVKQVLRHYIKSEIKEEIRDIDEEMKLYPLLQEKFLCDD